MTASSSLRCGVGKHVLQRKRCFRSNPIRGSARLSQIQKLVDDLGARAAADLEASMMAEADSVTQHILASLGDDPAKLVGSLCVDQDLGLGHRRRGLRGRADVWVTR